MLSLTHQSNGDVIVSSVSRKVKMFSYNSPKNVQQYSFSPMRVIALCKNHHAIYVCVFLKYKIYFFCISLCYSQHSDCARDLRQPETSPAHHLSLSFDEGVFTNVLYVKALNIENSKMREIILHNVVSLQLLQSLDDRQPMGMIAISNLRVDLKIRS